MARQPGKVGSVRLVRGRWLAALRGEYLGSYETEQEGWDAVQAAIDIDSGTAPDSLRLYGERWLDARETGGDIRGIKQERSVWKQHVATSPFYDWPLRKIRPKDVQSWLNDLSKKTKVKVTRTKAGVVTENTNEPISRGVVKHARRVLRACFRAAVIDGKLSSNPESDVITPKMARVVEDDDAWTFLSAPKIDELFRLLAGRAQLTAWYSVAIYGGLRLEEIKALQWTDVNELTLQVRRAVRAGRVCPLKEKSSRRDVPILAPLRAALQAWRNFGGVYKVGGPVFPGDGGYYGDSYDAGWAENWRLKLELPNVRFHDLRHTCGSHLVMGTWGKAFDLQEVRDWLGHADIQTTQRYAKLAPHSLANKVRDLEYTK